jgi:hypothetical protein
VTKTEPAGGPRPIEASLAFGCLNPRGQPRLLGSTTSGLTVYRSKRVGLVHADTVVLHAPWIAYTKIVSGIDTWMLYVVAVNLRTNSRRVCAVGLGGPDGGRPAPYVSELALAGDGNLAWTGGNQRTSLPTVAACDATGVTVLDDGEGVNLHSLSIRGSRVSWIHSGRRRAALLP